MNYSQTIDKQTKGKIVETLTIFPSLCQKIQNLQSDLIKPILRAISEHLRKDINFNFDSTIHNSICLILKSVDSLLNTQMADGEIVIAQKNLNDFPQKLKKVKQNYMRFEGIKQSHSNSPNWKEKMMNKAFVVPFPYWTFSEVIQLVDRYLTTIQTKYYNLECLTEYEEKNYGIFLEFRVFTQGQKLDLNQLDQIMKERIGEFNFSSSYPKKDDISSISFRSRKSSENYLSEQQTSLGINEIMESLTLDSGVKKMPKHRSKMYQSPQKQIVSTFEKTPQKMTVPTQKISKRYQSQNYYTQATTQCQTQLYKDRNEQISSFNKNQPQSQRISENSSAGIQISSKMINKDIQQMDPSFVDLKQNLSPEQKQQIIDIVALSDQKWVWIKFSQQMIRRYMSQYRFTKRREHYQVQQIIKNQCNPLVKFLKKLKANTFNNKKITQKISEIKIDLYGSFQNKCGFRKISDLNVNIQIPGLNDMSIAGVIQDLKDVFDLYKEQPALKTLDIKSTCYNHGQRQVIISHNCTSQQSKQKNLYPKSQNIINYIYIRINHSSHVESSRFMKEIIYNGQQKTAKIRDLTNLIHLVFKRNKILTNKNASHIYFDTRKQTIQMRKLYHDTHASISVYALHMMVLFYLMDSKQITRIRFKEQDNQYGFDLIDDQKTLFEQFEGFLLFYSSEGKYSKKYEGKSVINVMEFSLFEWQYLQTELNSRFNPNDYPNTLQGNKFIFLHPRTKHMIGSGNCIALELRKGTKQYKLFDQKINELLQRIKIIIKLNYVSTETVSQWDLELLFDSNNPTKQKNSEN